MKSESQSDWKCAMLRATGFLADRIAPSTMRDIAWFSDSTGVEPQQSTIKPSVGQLVEFAGVPSSGIMTLKIEGDRVDWIIQKEDQRDPDFPAKIPEYPVVLKELIPVVDRWLEKSDRKFLRIAFAGKIVRIVEDSATGTRLLKELLGLPLAENSTDVVFQANCPVDSTVEPGMKINQLAKWSVATFQLAKFDVNQAIVMKAQSIGSPVTFCNLEFDINTSRDNVSAIDHVRARKLFDELITNAEALFSKRGCR